VPEGNTPASCWQQSVHFDFFTGFLAGALRAVGFASNNSSAIWLLILLAFSALQQIDLPQLSFIPSLPISHR
jgi:hypothetical protein